MYIITYIVTTIKKVFPILALCVFSSTLGIGIVTPLLPLYVKNMGASGLWLGIIVAAYFVSNSIAVPFAGRLSDRRGRKIFLIIGLLSYAIISLGYLFAHDVALLALVRFIQGIAGAINVPIAMAYIGDLSPEREEGKWMGYANAAFFSGFGFGPLMGGILTDRFGQNSAFLAMGGLNLLAFLIALFLLPEVSRHRTSRESHLSFREMSTSRIMRGLFTFRIAEALGRGTLTAFLPIYAATLGLSTSFIGLLISISILSTSLLTPLGGVIADRFGRKTLIVLGNTIFFMSLAVIPLAGSFWRLLTVMLIQGIGSAISTPAASALAVEEGRKYGIGSTMAIFFLAMGIGAAAGPIISGDIADRWNINSAFYFSGALILIGTALFVWFTRQPRGPRPTGK